MSQVREFWGKVVDLADFELELNVGLQVIQDPTEGR
jgi:hypothetical protein